MRTFVVRVWEPADGQHLSDGALRGVVEEVATGEQATFAGGDQLLAELERSRTEGKTWDRADK